MSEHSEIEWTDATWNPVRGCTKITPGCDHCYAETFAERFRGVPGHPYEQGFDLRLVPEKLAEPLRWKTPKMIFVNSMSDLFHKDVPDDYVEAVGQVMERANWHTYQVLTKRSSRLRDMLQDRAAIRCWPSPHLVGRERRGPRSRSGSDQASAAGPGRCPIPVHRAAARRPGRDQPGRNPLGDRRRRERGRSQADGEGMGAVASRSVRASPGPVLLQAVGRRPQEQGWPRTRRQDLRRPPSSGAAAGAGTSEATGGDCRVRAALPTSRGKTRAIALPRGRAEELLAWDVSPVGKTGLVDSA